MNKNLQKKYDTIIIGGGLSGLLTAKHLNEAGQSTLLVEKNDRLGGNLLSGFKTVSNKNLLSDHLTFLSHHLSGVSHTIKKSSPITFDGEFKEFLGFGQEAPECIDELDYYLQKERVSFSLPLNSWNERLAQNYQGDFSLNTFATKISTEDKKATSVTLNGKKTIHCENVVFCCNPKLLVSLLGTDVLSNKSKKALSKNNLWTSVSLELEHSEPICEHSNLHVLMPKKDQTTPILGMFNHSSNVSQSSNPSNTSKWMALVPSASAEDHETITEYLKKIKKQVKRAYPEFFLSKESTENSTGKVSERITVNEDSHGILNLPLTSHQTLPELENFWVNSQLVHQQSNLVGVLAQTQLVLSSMGFTTNHIEVLEIIDKSSNIVNAE